MIRFPRNPIIPQIGINKNIIPKKNVEKILKDLIKGFITSFINLYKNDPIFKELIDEKYGNELIPLLKGGEKNIMRGGGSHILIMILLFTLVYTSYSISIMALRPSVAFVNKIPKEQNINQLKELFTNIQEMKDETDTNLDIIGLLEGVESDSEDSNKILQGSSLINGVVSKFKSVVGILESKTVDESSEILTLFDEVKKIKGFKFVNTIFKINSLVLKSISTKDEIVAFIKNKDKKTSEALNVSLKIIETAVYGMKIISIFNPALSVPVQTIETLLFPKETLDTFISTYSLANDQRQFLKEEMTGIMMSDPLLLNFRGGTRRTRHITRRRHLKKSLKRTRRR
jgi:hypothetical protein